MKKLFEVSGWALLFLCSCSVGQFAEQKVLTTPTLFNDIGLKFLALNPCANDTTIVGSTHTDTQYVQQAIQSRPGDLQSYADTTTTDTVFAQYAREVRVDTIKIRINHTDTVKTVDGAALARTRDSLRSTSMRLAVSQQSVQTANANTKAEHGKYTTLIWIDIAVVIAIVASVVILLLIKTGII